MSYIKLQDVCVTFAIYNSKMRSIRNQIFNSIGGVITSDSNDTYIKALANVSLEINEGTKIGLLGHNGAGKSTLLKVLSGVYPPTSGEVYRDGTVSSLTDITLGMDPELSGYDNVIMRCIFMGMTFAQANECAPKIIEFAEMEDYIRLPLRTYSTGMSLRLAFSIATSVTPDILVMDEMIGTGDANFIKKHQRRTMELIDNTKIMVIASHDLKILQDVCNLALWMERGRVKVFGDAKEVIKDYSNSL